MGDVVITGIGLISALGPTLAQSWQRLLQGASGIHQHQPFADLPPQPLGLIGSAPADPLLLTQQVVPAALRDAKLSPPLPDCGVVFASSRSFQARWEQLAQGRFGPDWLQNPALAEVADLYQTPLALRVAQQVGAIAPVLAPMAACASAVWAIAQGVELLQTGQCQRVLVGAVEAAISPLTLVGFRRMGALARTGAYPFDRDRQGLVLGEGAAAFVLETATAAQQRSAKVYGQILGFGLSTDAYHLSAPDPKRQWAIAAVQQCLERGGLTAREIHYIHAHGTGTILNDQAEAGMIQTLFPQGVAVSSTKGATGHTLGAAAALGTAFALMALQQQVLPPCVGLNHPGFDLDLVRVARSAAVRSVLCFSFGFGGQNAILALGNK